MKRAAAVDYMCDYLIGYYAGVAEEKVENVRRMVRTGKVSFQEASDVLKVDERALESVIKACARSFAARALEVKLGVVTREECIVRCEEMIHRMIRQAGDYNEEFFSGDFEEEDDDEQGDNS